MFSESARRVVAEDALKLAFRLGHDRVGSGHLLIAALDSRDRTTCLDRAFGEDPATADRNQLQQLR
jgi:hypothetical protein